MGIVFFLLFIGLGFIVPLIISLSGPTSSGGRGGYYDEEECPYCGSPVTDGNHCYDCDEDF